MKFTGIKEQIIVIARQQFRYKWFPRITNKKRHYPFRTLDDGTPFGFRFHGVDIEVHHQYISPYFILTIIGITEDKVRVIAEGVRVNG